MQHFAMTPPGATHAPHRRSLRCLFPHERSSIVRTPLPALLLAPLLVLATACADELVTAPQEALFSTSDGDAVTYQIIELGSLMTGSHARSRGNAIHGDPTTGDALVVGSSFYLGNDKAVVWEVSSAGDVTGPERLGELPEPFTERYPYQTARDVNSTGIIVGEALRREDNTIYRYFHVGWVFDGEMKVLPWFVDDTNKWFAWEVNDDGMVAGWIQYAAERDEDGNVTHWATRGALWLPPYVDEPILLQPLEGQMHANARTINNDGVIAGWSGTTGTDSVGVYWQADASGSVSGPYEIAPGFRSTALNDEGYVAGTAFGEAALWDPNSGSLIRLGILHNNGYSQAFGIDNAHDGAFGIVGWSARTLDSGDRIPTIWSMTNGSIQGPTELPLSGGFTGGYASDVDGPGEIVGIGYKKHRNQSLWQALLWRPVVGGGEDDTCEPHPRFHDRCK